MNRRTPHAIVMAGKPSPGNQQACEPPRVTLTCTRSLLMPNALAEGFGKPRCLPDISCTRLRRWSSVLLAAVLAVGLGGCGNTDSWVDAAAAQGWPAQYGDAANSSYTTTSGATKLSLQWTRSVKGSLAAGPALSARSYLALNAQTPAGCSLMEWENNDNGRQRWCMRLAQGGGFGGPLFDGFDNLYVGQPGAILSFPGDPVDALAPAGDRHADHPAVSGRRPAAGHHAPGTGAGFRRPPRRGGRQPAGPGGRASIPTDATRGLADCAPARPGCPVAAAPAFSAANGMVVLGVWQPGAPAAGLVGLKYHPGQTPLLDPRVDQRRRRRRCHRQPGVVRRRIDRLRQRPRPTAVGAERRRREGEVVGAAGISGPDAARGHPAGPDRVRRRPRHPAGGVQGCRRSRRPGLAPRRRHPAVVRRAWPAPASATPWSAAADARPACRCWSSIRPTATRSTAIRCPRPPDIPLGVVGRQRPPGGGRHQRRPGLRLRARPERRY